MLLTIRTQPSTISLIDLKTKLKLKLIPYIHLGCENCSSFRYRNRSRSCYRNRSCSSNAGSFPLCTDVIYLILKPHITYFRGLWSLWSVNLLPARYSLKWVEVSLPHTTARHSFSRIGYFDSARLHLLA